jgi:hypothetical protein
MFVRQETLAARNQLLEQFLSTSKSGDSSSADTDFAAKCALLSTPHMLTSFGLTYFCPCQHRSVGAPAFFKGLQLSVIDAHLDSAAARTGIDPICEQIKPCVHIIFRILDTMMGLLAGQAQ